MATIAEIMERNEQLKQASKSASTNRKQSDSEEIRSLNESIRVCRVKTVEKAREDARNERVVKGAIKSLRPLYHERNSLVCDIRRMNDELTDALDRLRIWNAFDLMKRVTVRKGKIVAKPGQKDSVSQAYADIECDFNSYFDIEQTRSHITDCRTQLKRVSGQIEFYTSILRRGNKRPKNPMVERNECIMSLIPLVNDESIWTEESEADLAEDYQRLTDRVTELRTQLYHNPLEYRDPPWRRTEDYPTGALWGAPDGGMDMTHIRREYNRLSHYLHTLLENDGENDTTKSISGHLAHMYWRMESLSVERNIVKRGHHYYRLNPAPTGKRVSSQIQIGPRAVTN